MEQWIRIWMLIIEFSALGYLLIMLVINVGWYLTKEFNSEKSISKLKFSIVIAVRNESNNIINLLNSVLIQNFPKKFFEIIIVNDSSEDNTVELIEKFKIENSELEIHIINSDGDGKKDAIKTGIILSKNDIIISTDGDCIVGIDWIKTYDEYFNQHEVKLVFGAVFYENTKSLLSNIFHLEFSTLVASGAGSAGIGLPLMGNGANMAFYKNAYLEVQNKLEGKEYASGDDVFLIHSFAKNFGNRSVRFLKSNSCIVETQAPPNIQTFINQRIRWGSKAKAYKNLWPMFVSFLVFIFNLTLGITAILSLVKIWFLALFALLIILKFLIDFPLVNSFSHFYKRRSRILLLLLLEIIYPFYIIFTSIFSVFIPYQWKGRKKIK